MNSVLWVLRTNHPGEIYENGMEGSKRPTAIPARVEDEHLGQNVYRVQTAPDTESNLDCKLINMQLEQKTCINVSQVPYQANCTSLI